MYVTYQHFPWVIFAEKSIFGVIRMIKGHFDLFS